MKSHGISEGTFSPIALSGTVDRRGEIHHLLPLRRLALSISEAGILLGVGRSTAYAMHKKGELPTICIGGKNLVAVVALEKMVATMASQGMEVSK